MHVHTSKLYVRVIIRPACRLTSDSFLQNIPVLRLTGIRTLQVSCVCKYVARMIAVIKDGIEYSLVVLLSRKLVLRYFPRVRREEAGVEMINTNTTRQHRWMFLPSQWRSGMKSLIAPYVPTVVGYRSTWLQRVPNQIDERLIHPSILMCRVHVHVHAGDFQLL